LPAASSPRGTVAERPSSRRPAVAGRRGSQRETVALAALLAVAAAVRFIGIGAQSLWLDEVVTFELVSLPFGDTLSTIPDSESTPYLYYVLLWPWADVVGHGEAALRSLSAVFGVLTVAAIWAAARSLVSERAGLVAAALAAVNPFLVWYSQEARAYALLALLCAVSFWLFARALERGDGRSLAWWAIASALALATHYFAAFTIFPEAIALAVLAGRTRAWALACGAIGLAAAALAPLAAEQRRGGGADWIGDISLGHRIAEIPKRFVAGEFGNQLGYVFWPVLLIALASLVLLLWRSADDERRGGVVALVIGGAGLVVPIAFALATLDYVFPRNLIGSLPPLLVAFAAALTAARARLAGGILLAAVLALSALALVRTGTDDALQRDDWRTAVDDLDRTRAGAIVVSPADNLRPLRHYYPRPLFELVDPGVGTSEIAVLDTTRAPIAERIAPRPPPGFAVAEIRDTDTYRIVLLRSSAQMVVGPGLARRAAARPDNVHPVADLER
jgi:mannosyltransferase